MIKLNSQLNNFIKLNNKQINFSKEIYYIYFYLFCYYIYNNKINKIYIYSKNFIYFFYKKSIYNYYFFYLYKLSNNLRKYNFIFYYSINSYLFIFLEFLKNKINLLKYNKFYLFFKPKINLYLFDDVIFRIDLLILFRNWEYIKYYKIYKYNEYINLHPILYKYPNLKKFLVMYFFKTYFKKIHKQEYTIKGLLVNTQIYIIKKSQQYKKYIKSVKNLNFLYNKIKLINLFNLLKNKNYFIMNYCIKLYSLPQFFYFIYNIWLLYYEEDDWVEIKKYKADNFFILFWKFNRYGFKFNEWVTLYSLKYYYEYIFDDNILNILNLKLLKNNVIKTNIKKYSNIFLYKILNLILLEYIYVLFFKFLSILEKVKIKKFIKTWSKTWVILKRAFVFDWLDVLNFENVKNKFNINSMIYSFLFIGNNNFSFNIDFVNLTNKLILDSFLLNQKVNMLTLINTGLKKFNIIKQTFINFLIIYLFLRDINIKLLFNIIIFNNINNNKFNINLYYIIYDIKKAFQNQNYINYIDININLYLPKYSTANYIYLIQYLYILLYKYITRAWKENCGLFYKKKYFFLYGYLNR